MNRQITRLAVVGLVLLAALVVGTTYWQAWAASGLADRQDNSIQRVAEFSVKRGKIYAADGRTVLADNVRRKVDGQTLYFRKLPAARARGAHRRLLDPGALARGARVVGERLPDGLEHEPQHGPRHDARQAEGNDGQGQRPRTSRCGPSRSGSP